MRKVILSIFSFVKRIKKGFSHKHKIKEIDPEIIDQFFQSIERKKYK
jgi:hypothetical protein